MTKQTRSVTKRSMTFSGCFTCRRRGVKCDEQRPTCSRCAKAKRVCAGYGVTLIWEEDRRNNSTPRSQRRHLPQAYSIEAPVLSDEELDSAIEALDSLDPNGQRRSHASPFTVFEAFCSPDLTETPELPLSLSSWKSAPKTSYPNNDTLTAPSPLKATSTSLPQQPLKHRECRPSMPYQGFQEEPINLLVMQRQLAVFITSLPPLSSEEARLLHHWVSYTSGLMIPVPREDNPFRTIFVPLALSAQAERGQSSENLALLHGIYAMTAFNLAQQQSASTNGYNNLGVKHHRLCLKYLQRSLAVQKGSQPEAILATIILMITIDCMTGDWSAWRMHIRGGRQWLLSAWNGQWKKQHATSTLHQIFLILEAVGTSRNVGNVLNQDLHHDYSYDSVFGVSVTTLYHDYQLDRLFGVSQPILEAIVHINDLGSRKISPSQQELESLRIKILLNDPRALRLDGINDETERKLLRHHSYVFYFACRIHFERVLYRVAPHKIQHFVRGALEHLEAIADLEVSLNVMGLMWPVFVTACEADDKTLQERVGWYFGKGQKHGIWGISSAHKVVSEVWRRREEPRGENKADVRWQQVMADLGLDLLLT